MKIIINVGRQLGSGGHIIAKMLASDFGCKLYDRELLNLAAKESGFSKDVFEQNDERKGFLKSLFHIHAPYVSDNSFYNNNLSQESLFQFQSDAIRNAADRDSCVFVGRCADYILREYKNTVNVFVTANIEDRINKICECLNCDAEAASKYICSHESDRSSYYNYYTGKKWGHSSSYDICVNSSVLGLEVTEAFIREFINKRFNLE